MCRKKPSLYIEELRSEFKDNLHHFKDGDEAFDRLIGFVELTTYTPQP